MAKQQTLRSLQAQMGRQAAPYYSPLLEWFAGNAGLQLPAMGQTPGIAPAPAPRLMAGRGGYGVQPQMTNQQRLAQMQPVANIQPMPNVGQGAAPPGGLPNSALGVYGQNPADVFRLQQAQEDIGRMENQGARRLQYQLGQQGIGDSATLAAALARNQQAAQHQFGDFRRNLAINAGTEQERRLQQLLALLGFGAGQGAQAQQVNLGQQQIAAQKPSILSSLAQFAPLFSPIKL